MGCFTESQLLFCQMISSAITVQLLGMACTAVASVHAVARLTCQEWRINMRARRRETEAGTATTDASADTSYSYSNLLFPGLSFQYMP